MRTTFNVRKIIFFIALGLFFVMPSLAQETAVVTPDTPVSIELESSDSVITVEYQAVENQSVIIQAMSDIVHPSLRVFKDGVEIAKYRAPEGATSPTITLPAYLSAGTYTIQVRALNDLPSPARVLIGITGQNAISPQPLAYGETAQGLLASNEPVALHGFEGVFEQSQLIINFTPVGADVRVIGVADDETLLTLSSQSIGGRVYLPPFDGGEYHIAIVSGETQPISYTLCYVSILANCGESTVAQPTAEAPPSADSCTATPINAGGANIRQSASTAAPIIGALAGGQSVPVIGIDPSGSWYQVVFNTNIGWASLTAVSGQGDCAGLPPINPPPVATAVPQPDTAVPSITPLPETATPSGPTPVPTYAPTATVTPGLTFIAVTFQPVITLQAPLLTLVPIGTLQLANPCKVTFTAPEYIYTRPNAIVDYLLHQMAGVETVNVLGQWNNNAQWLKIDYYDGWWYNGPGANGVLSGNCSNLPQLSAP